MSKKLTSILLALILTFSITACKSNETNVPDETADSNISTTETTNTEDTTPETVEIVDMLGRTVLIPSTINHAYCTQPVGAIYVYHVNPDKLLGWNYEPTDDEKVLLLEEYRDLNTYGMGGSTNYEAIIESAPEVCIYTYESESDSVLTAIEDFQNTLNIPVVALNYNLSETVNAYTFLGELLGEQEQAQKLADYTQDLFDSIIEIPESEQKTLYFGNGTDSLETAPVGSTSAQEFELLYINNVAQVENADSSRINISNEQILQWNPEIIIVNGEPSDDLSEDQAVIDILNNPIFENVLAVTKNQVYGVPKSPFSFISRPTGPNRLMGIKWLQCLVYPEYYDFDMIDATCEFYSLFYHIDLTDDQVNDLLF